MWSQELRHANAHAVMYARGGVSINRKFLVCESVLGQLHHHLILVHDLH